MPPPLVSIARVRTAPSLHLLTYPLAGVSCIRRQGHPHLPVGRSTRAHVATCQPGCQPGWLLWPGRASHQHSPLHSTSTQGLRSPARAPAQPPPSLSPTSASPEMVERPAFYDTNATIRETAVLTVRPKPACHSSRRAPALDPRGGCTLPSKWASLGLLSSSLLPRTCMPLYTCVQHRFFLHFVFFASTAEVLRACLHSTQSGGGGGGGVVPAAWP